MTAKREAQIASLVGNLSITAVGVAMNWDVAGWKFWTVFFACGIANVAGYFEGQASVRRYLDGER